MTSMNRPSAFTAAVPSPGTLPGCSAASQTLIPIVSAWERTRPSDVAPIPRFGEFATRANEIASCGLESRIR